MALIFKRPFKYQAIIFNDGCDDDSDEVIVGDWNECDWDEDVRVYIYFSFS